MNDPTQDPELEAAFDLVLNHPCFHEYSRTEFASCTRFCEIIRQSPHKDVVELQIPLEEIAYASDDHNEASGVLLNFIALGGGLNNLNEDDISLFGKIPVDDAEQFSRWVISLAEDVRDLAHKASTDALLKRVAILSDDDLPAKLIHRKVNSILYYALESAETIMQFGNYAFENFEPDFNAEEQIPELLWETFNSRSKKETSRLLKKWWGGRASTPNDFFIALDWQRKGYIDIHQGRNYHATVAEYLLSCCEPGFPEQDYAGRSSFGERAIELDSFLVEELYEALSQKESYRWLISEDIPHRADYLNSLFDSGVLDRKKIIAVLNDGIAARWDSGLLESYKVLRERISC